MLCGTFEKGHPPDEMLKDYMLGRLGDWELLVVEAHFQTKCPRCTGMCDFISDSLIGVSQHGQCQRA